MIILLSAFLQKPGPDLHRSTALTSGARAGTGEPTPYPLLYPAYFGNRINTRDDNPLTNEGVYLGRRLFYEKKLSANNTISCGTCHQQQHAFTDGRTFSPGFDGTPTKRNSMSLANLLWVRNFFWDGRAGSLEAQAMIPLTDPHEMGQRMDSSIRKLQETGSYGPLFAAAFGTDSITHDHLLKALTQFERTLISANAPYDRYIRGEYQLDPAEKRGLDLFFGNTNAAMGGGNAGMATRSAGCGNCHGGPKTFNETYHNNGLDRSFKDSGRAEVTGMSYDRGRFRVVTLRNIALTAPYMHDGRFATLQEVIDHYSDHVEPSETLSATLKDTANVPNRLRLTKQEKSDLLAFLHTLTDTAFINDPRYSDPFVETPVKDKIK
jgi:cytochrome c peroxidase